MTSDAQKGALALLDQLRKRGAVEASIPIHDPCVGTGFLTVKFAGPLPLVPAAVEPASEEPDVAHREAPDCECKACRIAFGSAD